MHHPGIASLFLSTVFLWMYWNARTMLSTAGPQIWWILPAGFLIMGGMIREGFLCRECFLLHCSPVLLSPARSEHIEIIKSFLILPDIAQARKCDMLFWRNVGTSLHFKMICCFQRGWHPALKPQTNQYWILQVGQPTIGPRFWESNYANQAHGMSGTFLGMTQSASANDMKETRMQPWDPDTWSTCCQGNDLSRC